MTSITAAMLNYRTHDGLPGQASSWAAWRGLASLHMRRPCRSCDGTGERQFFIEGSGYQDDRVFTSKCTACNGTRAQGTSMHISPGEAP